MEQYDNFDDILDIQEEVEKEDEKENKKKKKDESSSSEESDEEEEESEEDEETEEESESDEKDKKNKNKIIKEITVDKENDINQIIKIIYDLKIKNEKDLSKYSINKLKIILKGCKKDKNIEKKDDKKNEIKKEEKNDTNKNDATETKGLISEFMNIDMDDFDQKEFQLQKANTITSQKVKFSLSNLFSSKKTFNNIIDIDKDYGVIIEDIKKCKTIETTKLSEHEDIFITVSDPIKEKGGIVKQGYVNYLITTFPLEFSVKRRYTDFVWLNQCLKKEFPSNIFPSIPKKRKLGQAKYSKQFIAKRARKFEKFLSYLLKDPLIKNSELLYDFLSIDSASHFSSKKKYHNNKLKLYDVREAESINGEINISVTKEKEEYFKNISESTEKNIKIFKKLQTKYKSFYKATNNIIFATRDISKLWDSLSINKNKSYNNKLELENCRQMSTLFKFLSDEIKEQGIIICVNLREHFRYIQKNYASLKRLIKAVLEYKDNYQKEVNNLINKKEEQIKKHYIIDRKKSMLEMCPSETTKAIKTKEFYGYFLNRSISEYERYIDLIGKLNKDVIVENINKLMKTSPLFLTNISQIISNLDMN